MLFFATGDEPTDKNLQRLYHLATNACYGNAERMNEWLCAVIQSKSLLPRVAAKHFTGFYHIGDRHYHLTAERRDELWSQLANELRRHVDAAHNDPLLQKDGPAGAPDTTDHPQTLGERIGALVEQLENVLEGTPEFNRVLAEIESIAIGDVRSDVQQLKNLLSQRRRKPDHHYWVARHIIRIQQVARQQHHLPAR